MKKRFDLFILGEALRYFGLGRLVLATIAIGVLFVLTSAQAQVRYDAADAADIKIRCKDNVKQKAKHSMRADVKVLHPGYLVEVKNSDRHVLVLRAGKAFLMIKKNNLSDFVKMKRYFYICSFTPDDKGGWHLQKIEIYPCRCRKGFLINGKRY